MEYFESVTQATPGFEHGVGFVSQCAEKLFDNNEYTKYCTDEDKPYVCFKMTEPVNVRSYTFTTGDDTETYIHRNPPDDIAIYFSSLEPYT
jgi:hypothetical protein